MMPDNKLISDKNIFILLIILITICYSNTFSVPWQFDDPPNITENIALHITDLKPETLWSALFSKPFYPGTLERPISNLSFAINWYFGKNNTTGYHIVNLFIHIITSFFVFKTTFLILQSKNLKIKSINDIYFISLLSTIIWAINPIQTQAVTYIVQRMASMAAMFFVFSLYNYIKARQSENINNILKYSFFCVLFFIISLGCKENAVTLIPSLLITELLFFNKKNEIFSKIAISILITANIILLIGAIYYFYANDLFSTITENAPGRPFSIKDRLLTQPSILIFYLTLLFIPSPTRLSIDHSFTLSTSLLTPWTTLPAILLITILFILSIIIRKKLPIISFSILFFLINHLIESTAIPLELIFEHRNYLPSFFLFLPVSVGLCQALNFFSKKNPTLHRIIFASISFLIIAIGLGTYARNTVWASEESLWADALNKAPYNARPLGKLGIIYGWNKEKNQENFRTAIALLQKCQNQTYPRTGFKPALIGNIGKVYQNYGMLDQAIFYYKQSLDINPDFITSRFDLAQALVLKGNFKDALEQINIVINKNDKQSRYFNLKTLILLWMGKNDEAAESSYQSIKRTIVNKERYFYNTGVALTRAGHYQQGRWFLKKALRHYPADSWIIYSLIENSLLINDIETAKKYALLVTDKQGISSLADRLSKIRTDFTAAPVNVDLILPIIKEVITIKSQEIEKMNI